MDGEHNLVDDPHMWLDPILVKEQVNNIRNELVIVDPKNAETYVSNAAAYNDLIDELDASFRSEFAECQTNVFVPFHAAFGYLADRYGLEEFALGGLAPDAEASAADIVEFVEFVEENNVKVVFSERLIDPRLAEVIAEEAGARVMVLDVIEGVDELGVDTYIDKMRQNLAALSEAMGCQ